MLKAMLKNIFIDESVKLKKFGYFVESTQLN